MERWASDAHDSPQQHHYRPASRRIDFDLEATRILEDTLVDHGIPFVAGTSWTTDAPHRETRRSSQPAGPKDA